MTSISAKVIADSITKEGNRITTMVVTMPRFILAEFNTHRMFSRNTSSSRAIPFEKMVKSIQDNPFVPIAWQKDHKGMQGTEYHTDEQQIKHHVDEWLNQRSWAVLSANSLALDGVTKQLCNRLLEPFMWCTVIVTATEWENFFALRCPQYEYVYSQGVEGLNYSEVPTSFRSKKDWIKFKETLHKESASYKRYDDNPNWLTLNKGQAEIHMMALAEAMWDAYNESTPKLKNPGEWHIPFGNDLSGDVRQWADNLQDQAMLLGRDITDLFIKVATARCARVSYTVVGEEDKPANYINDMKLHDRLLESKHMSPFEHCAMVPKNEMTFEDGMTHMCRDGNRWSGNFKGWIQYRQLINQSNHIN